MRDGIALVWIKDIWKAYSVRESKQIHPPPSRLLAQISSGVLGSLPIEVSGSQGVYTVHPAPLI